jgi:Protein of unknown function (DUF1501)
VNLTMNPPNLNRRSVLKIGTMGFVGLNLVDLLRAEASNGVHKSPRAVVNIHLDGGPPHQDMIDLKPLAPAEFRGEFTGIPTNVGGLELCELLPKLASIADKFAFIRSLTGSAGAHDAFQCQSGFNVNDMKSLGGRPALGSVIAKLQGSNTDLSPPFVDLMQGRPLVRDSARPGFLGAAYRPFRPDISHMFQRQLEAGMVNELAKRGENHVIAYTLNQEIGAERLDNRLQLLRRFDSTCKLVDTYGNVEALNGFTQQAVGLLTSGNFARAMDLSQENAATLKKYHLEVSGTASETSDDASAVKKLLLARRLIEAGVRCISLTLSDYDTHGQNFSRMRYLLPVLDQALHAFVTDLEERGMLDQVSIVVWGEFGRTPKINNNAGRDHWPGAGMALLAGGGMRTGQIIGATDKYGMNVVSRPVTYADVLATLYHQLGINPETTTLLDPSGRPQHLTAGGKVIHEVC